MTVGELRIVLMGLDSDMEVGAKNHYDDLLLFDGMPAVESVDHSEAGLQRWSDETKTGERDCLLFRLVKTSDL